MRGRDDPELDPAATPENHPSAWADGAGGVCMEVRGRLSEYALDTLSRDERAFVARHLEWCAGCRKEATALDEAAVVVGLSAPQAEPPGDLEERVVQRVAAAASRRSPWARRLRVLTVATVAAAVLAVLAVGWGAAMFAKNQSNEEKLHQHARQEIQLIEAVNRVMSSLISRQPIGQGPRDELLRAQLVGDGPAAAGAVVYVSPGQADWALVVAANLPRSGLPYRVLLSDGRGHTIRVGTIHDVVRDGSASLAQLTHVYTAQSLRPFDRVVVTDAARQRILTGRLDRSPPSPAAPSV